MHAISFRAKVETARYVDGSPAPSRIRVPRISAAHYDKAAFRASKRFGAYANSDMFHDILERALRAAGVGKVLLLDKLPPAVTVDQAAFLALVTINLED